MFAAIAGLALAIQSSWKIIWWLQFCLSKKFCRFVWFELAAATDGKHGNVNHNYRIVRIKKIFRNIFISISLMILVFYILLIHMWKIDFTQKEVDSYITEIKHAEKLPDLFYELYNLDTDNSLEYGSLKYVTKSLFYIKTVMPVSVWIAKKKYIPKKINRLSPKIFKIELSLATKIDNETSSNEQLNFMLKEADFVNRQTGVKSAAKFYFNKEINELNETEIASLIVMMRNPALYNPKKRPEKLKLEVEKLLKK